MPPYGPTIHHRRSIRLQGYDYAQVGAYFVTICSHDRRLLFGRVIDGRMHSNEFGRIVQECWEWLCDRYSYVDLDQWVLMPNHLHGVIIICDLRRGGSPVRQAHRPEQGRRGTAPAVEPPVARPKVAHVAKRKPLGRLIGAFKTVSTKRLNAVCKTPGALIWQRNYYEHVIRNEEDLNRIREYIITNPAQWAFDRENPDRTGPVATEPFL